MAPVNDQIDNVILLDGADVRVVDPNRGVIVVIVERQGRNAAVLMMGFNVPMNDRRMAFRRGVFVFRRKRLNAAQRHTKRARDESPDYVSSHRGWIIDCLQPVH